MSKIDPTAPPDLSNHKPPANVTFTEQELVNMDPSEREVAERMNLLAAEGIDPTLDEEEIAAIRAKRSEQQGAAAAAIEAQKPTEQPTDQGTDQGTDQPAGQQAEQAPAPAPVAEPPSDTDGLDLLPVGNISEMEAQRADLRKKVRDLTKQWVDGEIDQEAYDSTLSEMEARVDSLGDDIATNRAIQQQNEIKILNHQQATIKAIRARGAEIGLNYADNTVAQSFDTAMDLVEALPANAHLSFAELAEKAHAMVAAMHGKSAPAPAPAPTTTKPAPRVPPPIPKSLAHVPAAEIPNQGAQAQNLSDGIFSGKSPAEAEAAWEKLTDAQKKAILGDYA